jgi:hypothetical protein
VRGLIFGARFCSGSPQKIRRYGAPKSCIVRFSIVGIRRAGGDHPCIICNY